MQSDPTETTVRVITESCFELLILVIIPVISSTSNTQVAFWKIVDTGLNILCIIEMLLFNGFNGASLMFFTICYSSNSTADHVDFCLAEFNTWAFTMCSVCLVFFSAFDKLKSISILYLGYNSFIYFWFFLSKFKNSVSFHAVSCHVIELMMYLTSLKTIDWYFPFFYCCEIVCSYKHILLK